MRILPKKSLGQNFLINTVVLEKIVSAAELNKDDTILEIGPGTGNLTKLLSQKAGRVITIEKDRRLIDGLREKFKDSNVEIVEGDVLKIDIGTLLGHSIPLSKAYGNDRYRYKVVANIPYYITSHLLKTIFEKWPKPKLIVLTVQKEVAKRITAKPPEMNLLALSVQLYSEPKIISYVSKGSFRPIPKVDSAIIKLTPNQSVDAESIKKVLLLAKKAFAGKRKQLKNTLPNMDFTKLSIPAESRPEELVTSDWLKIAVEV